MEDADFALIRGSGNTYQDLGIEDADARQLKALLAAEIIKTLDKRGLSVRKAHGLTGIDAGDFSRIRNADFRRMTVERLMTIVKRLGSRIEFKMRLRPIPVAARYAPMASLQLESRPQHVQDAACTAPTHQNWVLVCAAVSHHIST